MSNFYMEIPEESDDLYVHYDPETKVVSMAPKQQNYPAGEPMKELPHGWVDVGYTTDVPDEPLTKITYISEQEARAQIDILLEIFPYLADVEVYCCESCAGEDLRDEHGYVAVNAYEKLCRLRWLLEGDEDE